MFLTLLSSIIAENPWAAIETSVSPGLMNIQHYVIIARAHWMIFTDQFWVGIFVKTITDKRKSVKFRLGVKRPCFAPLNKPDSLREFGFSPRFARHHSANDDIKPTRPRQKARVKMDQGKNPNIRCNVN